MITALVIAVLVAGMLVSCVYIIYERNSPSATMAWLLAMVFLPFIGIMAYFIFGRRRLNVRLQLLRAIREEVGDIWEKLDFDGQFKSVLRSDACDPRYHDLMRLAYRSPGLPPTPGNSVRVINDAENAYPAILESIAAAKHHIHVLYFIIQPDSSGRMLRDALTERAKAGVEVRVLYDDIGSWKMKPEFFRPLTDAGGRVHEYRPVRFSRFRTFYANFRNHRKIVVIDGEEAFTGGINIGDEYLGLDPKVGFWRDTNIKVVGPAASHLQLVFAEDWYYATGELLTDSYIRHVHKPAEGGGTVQVVPSGPDRLRDQVELLYFTAITSARKSLYITSPYFVPDESVLTALMAASMRGVDVRLLVPKEPDKRIVKYAGWSYFRELLAAGCRIYEYTNGFIHSKTMSVDGEVGIVGTANMDIRSFRLNFEVCVVCYDKNVAEELDEQFMTDLNDSERIIFAGFSKRPKVDILLENMARITSALL